MSDQTGITVPDLQQGEIHLWTVSIDALKNQVKQLESLLSEEEKKKKSFYKFEHTQLSYVVSQAVLRMLLASYLDIKPGDVKLGTHKKGKPYLIHDRSIFFNISNSHDLCVYAFSGDAEVGIDLEKIRDLPDLDQMIEKNLTRYDLYVCDEFFLTGTAAEVIGIVEIDGRIIGDGKPGPVTKLLRKKFFKYAHGK